MRNFIVLFLFASFLFSCSQTEETVQEPQQAEISQKDEGSKVSDEKPNEDYPVEGDEEPQVEISEEEIMEDWWTTFKTAILFNDTKSLATMCNEDNVHIQTLVDSFDDPDFRKTLEESTYEILELDEAQTPPMWVFSATVTGDDGDGNIFESGLYLYFIKEKSGFKLEQFLAAG